MARHPVLSGTALSRRCRGRIRHAHGRRGDRFLHLAWSRPPRGAFRRVELLLREVPDRLLDGPEPHGLRGLVGLTMDDGSPLCAAARPPAVTGEAL